VGGSFILKIYDCGFELTRQLILLLALYYSVKIVKPVTSRPGNSEKYLLCEHFTGISE
jgi:23S rRNA U2552 (ribose-2'-O)-methylase RlmE/FtsJ